jgi:disulfide bond formation protein DsbB
MGWNKFMKDNGMHLSWLVALVATAGSLYFSEVLHYIPCKLCWYQRILMYPLIVILGIAAAKKDYRMTIYVLPLTLWGAGISIYHYLMQKTDLFKSAANSCGIVPCDVDYINWLGFITIPFLAGTAFILISLLQFFTWRATRNN